MEKIRGKWVEDGWMDEDIPLPCLLVFLRQGLM